MINKKDIKFEYFRRSSGHGGQRLNKTSSAVRATHIPTGIVVESSDGRSQSANKKVAIEKLQNKLDTLAEEEMSLKRQEAYNNKSDSSFASQIRTYKLCGKTQNVVDHRTGTVHPSAKSVLDGDIDVFLKAKPNE